MSFAWHEIRDHLMHSSTNLHFQRSFDAVRREQAALAAFRDPAALLDGLHRTSGDQGQKNLILDALVRAAQSDGPASDCALTILLLALWPGLDAIRRRSLWHRLGVADEIASDVLARTTEAVRGLNLDCVNWIAATVLRNVERDMIRARKRELTHDRLPNELEPLVRRTSERDPAISDARLNAELRSVIGDDALLVIRVAIEGFSQAEVAVELGLTEAAARKRYQRAMRRLHDALEEIP
jgi:RNA polymerase sigma-70 factor (ECF subfamily)